MSTLKRPRPAGLPHGAWIALVVISLLGGTTHAGASQAPNPEAAVTGSLETHQHETGSAWHVMQDAVLFFTYNQQGGPKGGAELTSQNWWMGMAERARDGRRLRFTAMFSLEPATIHNGGYRHLFQVGETYKGKPLADKQHPHDFLMQAAVSWRVTLPDQSGLTLAAAPVGEASLGPVAFMHRASALENPTAPLGHHTLDSTHIAMTVLSAAWDKGPLTVESSIFRGREPDEQRWDLVDTGAIDSWATRGWYRPNAEWTLQFSHGFLTNPEALEPGHVRRTTASVGWFRPRASAFTAVTIVYGRNDKHGRAFNAALAEVTHTFRKNAIYTRLEALQVDSGLLGVGIDGSGSTHTPANHEENNSRLAETIGALTLGVTRTLARPRQWDVGVGGDLTFYAVPSALRATHGGRPRSLHVFLRIRPPAPMGRMVETTMTGPMHR